MTIYSGIPQSSSLGSVLLDAFISILDAGGECTCAGFSWDTADFFKVAMFWIYAEHRVNTTGMFLLLLRSAYRDPKDFSAFEL